MVSLTERGRAVVQERHARLEPRWRAALQEFSHDELLTAARVLDRLAALFDDFDDNQA
jgi:DNA-binding MarR family transcriptional regulator